MRAQGLLSLNHPKLKLRITLVPLQLQHFQQALKVRKVTSPHLIPVSLHFLQSVLLSENSRKHLTCFLCIPKSFLKLHSTRSRSQQFQSFLQKLSPKYQLMVFRVCSQDFHIPSKYLDFKDFPIKYKYHHSLNLIFSPLLNLTFVGQACIVK